MIIQVIKQRMALWRYLCQIRKCLPGPRVLKKAVIYEIGRNIGQYLQASPDADFSQIENHFGRPKDIAKSYIGDLDMQELVLSVHKRNQTVKVILGCASVVLLLWAVICARAIWNHYKDINGYAESYIIDLSTEPPADLP